MDLRRTPVGVFLCQPPDQDSEFRGDSWPAITPPGSPSPIHAETSPMPIDDRFGFHDYEHVLPASPDLPKGGPEYPVHRAQGRPGPPAFQNGHLLAQSEDFEGGIGAAPEEDACGGKQCDEE